MFQEAQVRNATGGEKTCIDPAKLSRTMLARPHARRPLEVIEDAGTGHRFVTYTTGKGARLNLRFDGAEPWFTLRQIAALFGVDMETANRHVRQFLKDGELSEDVVQSFETVRREDGQNVGREVEYCSLDAAFYVGYRVNSQEGGRLRRWASDMLLRLGAKGFAVEARRVDDPDEGPNQFAALLEKIHCIRTSEKRMWTRVLELASFCSDYGQAADAEKRDFFSMVQNAMHWAVTGRTAAEVIYERIDASKPNVGVLHFEGGAPTVREALTAKNFYTEEEIRTLNLVTGLVLEFFESQAQQRRQITLAQFVGKLRALLELDGRPVLQEDHESAIKMEDARKRASDEMRARNERLRARRG
jgi:hypothetical protein